MYDTNILQVSDISEITTKAELYYDITPQDQICSPVIIGKHLQVKKSFVPSRHVTEFTKKKCESASGKKHTLLEEVELNSESNDIAKI